MKNFKNIFTLLVVALVGLSLTGCSEDDLDTNPFGKSGVNLVGFGPSPILRTHEIRITGTNMDKVTKVIFPGDVIVERSGFNSSDAENIYVNVPDESVPGQIRLVAGSDTVTSVSKLTFEEPIEVTSVTPTAGLNAGDEITIKGDYVYNIAEVIFHCGVTGAPVVADEFTYISRREIRLRVPLAAESGTITMNDGAEWEYEYPTPLEIVSATYISLDPAAADFGQQIKIHGTNLHTVETVMFGGGVTADFTVSSDNKTITVTVPAECKSGVITLLLYSGAALTTDEFAVPTVTIASATPNNDLCEGDQVVLTGENFDRVKEVYLPGFGQLTDYTISGNTLTFTVPEGMTDGDIQLVQNPYITATIAVEMRKLAGVIWQGKVDLSGWSNWGVFNWDGDKWLKFQEAISGPGQLTLHFVATNDNPIFNFRMGDWSTPYSDISLPYGDDGNIRPGDATDIVVNLSAEEREKMFADGGLGMVIWGDGIQLQYIKFIAEGADKVIWEGSEDMGEWSNQPYIGSDAGAEFVDAGAYAGQKIHFYGTATDSDWEFQVFEGHWGPQYAGWLAANDNEELESKGCLTIELTQAMLDAALTQQWWGGIFVVQGKHFILTKVTLGNM
ncbi:MAG: hypothetical protein K6C10_05465 [Prevotella sp.]|nr:hypothetical protein [Prevotella sp.]